MSAAPTAPGGQASPSNVTQAQFEAIALAQVTELWTTFGSLNFRYTSFNCGNRSFHLFVTILAERRQPGLADAAVTAKAKAVLAPFPRPPVSLEMYPSSR